MGLATIIYCPALELTHSFLFETFLAAGLNYLGFYLGQGEEGDGGRV